MQLITAPKQPTLELVALSDLHVGAHAADLAGLKAVIEGVRTTAHRYVVLIGDLTNAALAHSKSNIYEETLHPQQELDLLKTLLTPIQDKILAMVPGNHEERIWRTAGIDVSQILAEKFNIPYSPTAMLLELPVGSQTYSVYLHHGTGGGRTTTRFEGNHRFSQIVDADLYISGHIHSGHVAREGHFHTDGGKVSLHEQVFVTTTSWLGYESYAEKFGYKPSVIRPAYIRFDPATHQIEVLF